MKEKKNNLTYLTCNITTLRKFTNIGIITVLIYTTF